MSVAWNADDFESAAEVLARDCRGYFSHAAKLLAEGSYLVRQQNDSLKTLGIDRLVRAFSEVTLDEVEGAVEKVSTLLEMQSENCVRVLLRGAVSFSLEQCGDYLHDSPASQAEAHDEAIAYIESSALALVQNDLQKGLTESAGVLCELGSSTLRRRLYEWALDHCPQTLAKLTSGAELEEFLLRHDYSVSVMARVDSSFSTTTTRSRRSLTRLPFFSSRSPSSRSTRTSSSPSSNAWMRTDEFGRISETRSDRETQNPIPTRSCLRPSSAG